MDIEFVKLQSAGRDFILVDGIKTPPPEVEVCEMFAERITHRNFGVGGCALVVLQPGELASLAVRIHGLAEQGSAGLGDALLCSARYAFDSGLLEAEAGHLEAAGAVYAVALVDSESVMLDMGPPGHWQRSEEMEDSPHLGIDEPIRIRSHNFTFSPLRLLGLHAVFFDVEEGLPVTPLRKRAVKHPGFPVPPLVELVRLYGLEEMRVRIWSPGAGELLSSACGSGAAVVTSVVHGFTERECVVHTRGGETYIRWDERSNHVLCTSSVEYTFMGTYYWEG